MFLTLLESEHGSIIFSVLLGLGLASMFRKTCKKNGCYVVKGPPLKEISNKIFKIDQKCYKYIPNSTLCKNE